MLYLVITIDDEEMTSDPNGKKNYRGARLYNLASR